MWDSLQEQVALERRQLHRLFSVYRPLLEKCAASAPDDIELSALAAMLHSFYNGMENIFKRVTLELGDPMPGGESWHKELLDSMTDATGNRNAVLSPQLWGRLKEYMEFRHVFRHAADKSAWDVYYQIKLFHQDDKTDLPVTPPDLKEYFKSVEKGEKKLPDLLANILIRRTRNHILRWYGFDSETHRPVEPSRFKECLCLEFERLRLPRDSTQATHGARAVWGGAGARHRSRWRRGPSNPI